MGPGDCVMTVEPRQHVPMTGAQSPSDSTSAMELKEVEGLYPEI